MAETGREVENRFAAEEVRLQARLRQITGRGHPGDERDQNQQLNKQREENKKAERRNKQIIRDLDNTVGRLRTRAIYSPTDAVLKSAKATFLTKIKALRAEKADQCLDFSFKGLTSLEGLKGEKPRKSCKKSPSGRYLAVYVKLNNNEIGDITGISTALSETLETPLKLSWLDLSFNRLLTIPPEISSLPSLKILYLHGNHLVDLMELLSSLRQLQDLYGLTLHGNPVEERKNYRTKVLSALPHLRTLDFSNITNADRAKLKSH